jgi:glucokinase
MTPAHSLVVDFGGTEIKAGLALGGVLLASRSAPATGTPADVQTAARLLSTYAVGEAGSVGVAVPGVVDRRSGTMLDAQGKYAFAVGFDFGAWALREFGFPALVENDARAALAGEVSAGAASGASDAVIMVLGTGIGTSAMVGGELVRGAHDHAGILGGHLTVELDGPACKCGNRGCAEAVASTWALERDIRAANPAPGSEWSRRLATGGLGLRDLFETPEDPVSKTLLERYLRAWGASVVSLCHSYDPDVVVLSGGVLRSAAVILPAVSTYVDEHLWRSAHRPRIAAAADPDLSVLRGLAALTAASNE